MRDPPPCPAADVTFLGTSRRTVDRFEGSIRITASPPGKIAKVGHRARLALGSGSNNDGWEQMNL